MSSLQEQLHPVSLSFRDASLEAQYHAVTLPRLRWHARLATIVGLAVYGLFGILDSFYVPPALQDLVWQVRAISMLLGVAALMATWASWYARWGHTVLMVSGLVAGASTLTIFWFLPPKVLEHYYAALLLLCVFIYDFVGVRFSLALLGNLILLAAYNVLFVWLQERPREVWMSHNLHLVCANILAGTAAYLAEYRQRKLFLIQRYLKQDAQQMRHDALHDALTRLPNRVLLLDRLEQALSHARRTGQPGAVLFVDLDGFKAVNDLHGHGAGDEVLREVARRMRRCLRESDTLCRLGGDEFVALTPGVGTVQQLQALTDKLRAEIQLAFVVPTIQAQGITKVWVDASMGATFFPPADLRAEDLLNSADEAMYRAKRSGRSLELGVLHPSGLAGQDDAHAA